MIVRDVTGSRSSLQRTTTMTELILRSGKANPSFGLSVKEDDLARKAEKANRSARAASVRIRCSMAP